MIVVMPIDGSGGADGSSAGIRNGINSSIHPGTALRSSYLHPLSSANFDG